MSVVSTDPNILPFDSSASVASAAPYGVPSLPGVDSDLALARLGGNVALYRQVAGIFARSHGHALQEIGQALDQGQRQVALRLTHTMKGAAATLGAMGLAASFQEVDNALVANDVARVRQLLAAMAEPMDTLVAAIGQWPPAQSG